MNLVDIGKESADVAGFQREPPTSWDGWLPGHEGIVQEPVRRARCKTWPQSKVGVVISVNRLIRTGSRLALVIGGFTGGLVGGIIGGVTVATALSRPAATSNTYYECLDEGLLSKVQLLKSRARKADSYPGARSVQEALRVFKELRVFHTTCPQALDIFASTATH
jgi:hypothetical protein